MSGIDGFTKLMLHMNGTDTSTVFTDDSASAHSVTANGNAQIDTAQSVFGGASGLFDGTGDYLSIPDNADFDVGGGDWCVDFRVRFNTVPTGAEIAFFYNQYLSSSRAMELSFNASNGGFGITYSINGTTNRANQFRSFSPVVDTDYHIAFAREGVNLRIFVDGTQLGTNIPLNTDVIFNSTTDVRIGADENGNDEFDGHIDEYRFSNGDARFTSNFTPPSSEYTDDSIQNVNVNTLDINSTVETSNISIDIVCIPNTLDITSAINSVLAGNIVTVTPNTLDIVASVEDPTPIIDTIVFPNTLDILSDVQFAKGFVPAEGSLIAKIISVNPLIAITNTSPAKIIEIDTTDPENLVYTDAIIVGFNKATDVSIDSSGKFVFISGESGLIAKIEIGNLSNQTLINLNDTDNVTTIETNTDFDLIYAGTDALIGELYVLDNRDTFKIDSDFQALERLEFQLDSDFNIVKTFRINSDFQALGQITFSVDTDFKCFTKPVVTPPVGVNRLDVIEPIKLSDFQIFIDSIELGNTDLILDSISIIHSVGNESRAKFRVSRKHDQLNTTLDGNIVIITNQNNVRIDIRGTTEFDGKIGELNCQYNNDKEFIEIIAFDEEKPNNLQKVTLSLPSLDSRLSLYDILVQNPNINDPFVDPDNEDNPKKFKGIRVDLGTQIKQSNLRLNIFDSSGKIAQEITDGIFRPLGNSTYFWMPTVTRLPLPAIIVVTSQNSENQSEIVENKLADFDAQQRLLPINERKPWLRGQIRQQAILDSFRERQQAVLDGIGSNIILDTKILGLRAIKYFYIGTSLAPISEDLFILELASHFRQTIHDDVETDLGIFETGEAPFKTVIVRNGVKIAKPRLVDESNALYSVKDAEFNFIEYAKQVADLELEKLKNINGEISPDTSCTFNMTIDAYFYYQISLLTLINVDNTTTSGIYKNINGFPVSAKSIIITSSDRKVTIEADNQKSQKELEIIDFEFPNDTNLEFNTPATRTLIALKVDMKTNLKIESDRILEAKVGQYDSKGNLIE